MSLDRQGLMNFTLSYIVGECMIYHGRPPGDLNKPEVWDWIARVHDIAWKYCQGRKDLDASVSDFEIHVATKMKAFTKPFFDEMKRENDEILSRSPNTVV